MLQEIDHNIAFWQTIQLIHRKSVKIAEINDQNNDPIS
jgi:hypothetical protein